MSLSTNSLILGSETVSRKIYLLLVSEVLNETCFNSHAHATHFWLNEGFTTYMERVLQQKLHSSAARGFSYVIGAKGLKDALRLYEDRPKYQRLVINFEKGEDPDDAYSEVPYEKGSNFLLYLGKPRCPHVLSIISTRICCRTHIGWPRRIPALHPRLRQHIHRQEHYN